MTVEPRDQVTPKDVFVGRRELFEALVPQIHSDEALVADTFGVRGIGKSSFIHHLTRRGKEAATDGIFLHNSALELGGAPSGEPTREPHISLALQRFSGFLERVRDGVLAQCPQDRWTRRQFTDFNTAVSAAKPELTQISINIENRLKAVSIGPDTKIQDTYVSTEHALRDQVEKRRARIAAPFAKALQEISFRRPLLWAIDDFESIADRPPGDWLLDLIGRIDGGLVVLARTPAVEAPAAGKRVLPVELTPLSVSEVREFLELCLPGVEVAPAVPPLVCEFTDGHAGTLGLVAELLGQDPGLAADAEQLNARFRALPDDFEDRQIELARAVIPSAQLPVVQTCAVVRHFDAPLLATLLKHDLEEAERIIERLRRHTFIRGERDTETGEKTYRLHSFIRRGIERQLSAERRTELHERAATFHYRWLADFEGGTASAAGSYRSWYRYENRLWQRHMREWLYHQALADATAPAGALSGRGRVSRIRFTRVFLDAFWWWGCYVEFPFCRELIADWETSQQDCEWVKDLARMLNRYPTGWHKSEAKPGDWDEVRRALVKVRDACGLDVNPEALLKTEECKDARHTRGLIDLFLAHAARYRTPDSDAKRTRQHTDALAYYEEAMRMFEADEDAWEIAWTLFERADLHGERGAEQQARRDRDATVQTILEHKIENKEEDEELIANVHRVSADIERRGENAAGMVAALAHAVTHAYLFQNRPHPPDAYTAAFYQEMLDRTSAALAEVWGRTDRATVIAPLLAAPLIAERHDAGAVTAAAQAAGPKDLLMLLPRGPRDDELELERSAFLDEWADVRELVAAQAAHDLNAAFGAG